MPLLSKHSFFIMSLFDPYNIYYRKQSKTVNGQVIRKKPQDNLEYAVTRQEIPRALSVLSSFPDAVPVTEIPFSYTFIGTYVISSITMEANTANVINFSDIWPSAIESFINPFFTNTDDFFSFSLLFNIQAARFRTIRFPETGQPHDFSTSFETFTDVDQYSSNVNWVQSIYVNGETPNVVQQQRISRLFNGVFDYVQQDYTKANYSDSPCISRHYDEGLSILNSLKLGSYNFQIMVYSNVSSDPISITSIILPYTLTLSGVMKYRISI